MSYVCKKKLFNNRYFPRGFSTVEINMSCLGHLKDTYWHAEFFLKSCPALLYFIDKVERFGILVWNYSRLEKEC
jgi:hypothetical protein